MRRIGNIGIPILTDCSSSKDFNLRSQTEMTHGGQVNEKII
jgi:hypothetical protein